MKKENSFRDFEAVADWMIDEGYGRKELMCALGFSASGMLLGMSFGYAKSCRILMI